MSKGWQDISAQELEQLLTDDHSIQLVDVRNPDEYAAGHIKGTRLIPLSVLPVRLHEIDPDREVIFICRSGGRSSQACEYAVAQGFSKVRNMGGGMLSWQGKQVNE